MKKNDHNASNRLVNNHKPQLDCPIEGCEWKSQDYDAVFEAALTTALQANTISSEKLQVGNKTHYY